MMAVWMQETCGLEYGTAAFPSAEYVHNDFVGRSHVVEHVLCEIDDACSGLVNDGCLYNGMILNGGAPADHDKNYVHVLNTHYRMGYPSIPRRLVLTYLDCGAFDSYSNVSTGLKKQAKNAMTPPNKINSRRPPPRVGPYRPPARQSTSGVQAHPHRRGT